MLHPDYRDILSTFNEEKVEYLLVGAFALAAHGLPRSTGDIDLWVNRSAENAKKVFHALAIFGAPLTGISDKDFVTPDLVFQIGVAPNRVDILTTVSGVSFEEAWSEREEFDIEGIRIPVIGRRLLIQNKKSTGRLKDEADAVWLEGNQE